LKKRGKGGERGRRGRGHEGVPFWKQKQGRGQPVSLVEGEKREGPTIELAFFPFLPLKGGKPAHSATSLD